MALEASRFRFHWNHQAKVRFAINIIKIMYFVYASLKSFKVFFLPTIRCVFLP